MLSQNNGLSSAAGGVRRTIRKLRRITGRNGFRTREPARVRNAGKDDWVHRPESLIPESLLVEYARRSRTRSRSAPLKGAYFHTFSSTVCQRATCEAMTL